MDQTHLMGSFERFLLCSEEAVLKKFLDRLDAPNLLILSSLNTRLKYLVEYYGVLAWDFVAFLSIYVHKPGQFLAIIDGKSAMMYGESVFRFFLREPSSKCTLEICTDVSKIYHIQRFLEDDGYNLILPEGGPSIHNSVRSAVHQSYFKEVATWDRSGERSSHTAHSRDFTFFYIKGYGTSERKIILRLVRCEPYRHVLGAELSMFACCMSSNRAICPFSYSTFVLNFTFKMPGKAQGDRTRSADNIVIKGRRSDQTFRVIYGPPFGTGKVNTRETGARFLGDDRCWVITRARESTPPTFYSASDGTFFYPIKVEFR